MRAARAEGPIGDDALARFQALLLDLLERGASPEGVSRALLDEIDDPQLADYVAAFEPRCAEVASPIVRKWALRASAQASSRGTARSNKNP